MNSNALETCKAWVDCINRHDVDGLEDLACEAHVFFVEGETPTVGRAQVRPSWNGYFGAYPDYVVYEDELFARPDAIYVVGHTTGSHVPAEFEQMPSSVIWRCVVRESKVAEWSIYPGTPEHRERFGLS